MRIIARPAFKNKIENPYNYLLYTNLEKLGACVDEFSVAKIFTEKYDILHLHWPEGGFLCRNSFQAVCLTFGLLVLITIARLRGIRIIWTVHNIGSHEKLYPLLEKYFWLIFVRLIDGVISLSYTSDESIKASYPILKNYHSIVTPHGHYKDCYANHISESKARSILGLDPHAKVIAFIGKIRPYKNVLHLVKIFRETLEQDIFLLIAGKPDSITTAQSIEDAVGNDVRIKLFLETVPDDDLQIYFKSANLVVLPYSKILNSGTVLLSLTFGCPVLVPSMGSLKELQELVGYEWVKTYQDYLTSTILIQALNSSVKKDDRVPFLEKLDWQTIAQQTLNFYEKVSNQA